MIISDYNLSKFSADILSYRNGSSNYTYSFSVSKNTLLFSDSSSAFNQTFLPIVISDFSYNTDKFNRETNTNFVDFAMSSSKSKSTDTSESIITELNTTISKLETQLSSSIIDAELLSSAQADAQASKDVIISLRVAAGQGKSESDFSQYFPYLPTNTSS